MKKVTGTIFFLIDDTGQNKTISKVKIGLKIIGDDKNFEIPNGYNTDLLILIKAILNRWDNSSKEITLTTAQWNTIKGLINK